VSEAFFHSFSGSAPDFNFPVVIKPLSGSKGSGIQLASCLEDIERIIREQSGPLLLQEMIESSFGRDLRVVVIGGKAVACAVRRSSASAEFRSNYALGGTIEPASLDPAAAETAEKAALAIGMFVGGVDLLFAEDGYIVCEVNSVPGFYVSGKENLWGIDIPGTLFRSIADELS
jgi:RimK family alpha-L-glutamate ligase